MILCDKDIKKYIKEGKLIINPLNKDTIQVNGIDLRIGGVIARIRGSNRVFDYKTSDIREYYIFEEGKEFIIKPGEHILIYTIEYLKMPEDLVGFINIRSTYARLGLIIPPTIIDSKFEGQLTIGLYCSSFPIKLYKEDRIIYILLAKTSGKPDFPYTGKYLGQRGISLPSFK